MLKTLTVWNFALLEQVQIEFGPGLNILTGETGAGKSILIDSLGAILGHRMTAEAIRTGCDWLRVEAVFSIDGLSELHHFLDAQAIENEENTLIITRQITRAGKNMILINGCHVTLSVLRSLGEYLVDIHGQNENLALLRADHQFYLLDHYAAETAGQLQAYQRVFHTWNSRKTELKTKEQAAMEYEQRIDMLRWQYREIEEAQLREHEDEELETEIRRLTNAEKIAGYVEDSYALLDGEGGKNAPGILAALAKIKHNLEALSRYDEGLENSRKMVEDAACQLQEASYELRDYGENMEFDAPKLDRLQNRMDVIYKLRKKYGATIDDVLQHQQKVKAELDEIENYDEDIEQLKLAIQQDEALLKAEAQKLSALRAAAAKGLSAAVEEQLLALGMPKARFHIVLEPLQGFAANGADKLAMLFSANPGEAEKPIQKVASGGELSRIALAIKTVAASRDDSVSSMVFDEIDTGIGGKTAQMVAERIALVAAYKQVLCITHLPQIACMADEHLYISKESIGDKTTTQVKRLADGERINEIARMASGIDVTAASLDNAREMVDNARIKKAKQRKAIK